MVVPTVVLVTGTVVVVSGTEEVVVETSVVVVSGGGGGNTSTATVEEVVEVEDVVVVSNTVVVDWTVVDGSTDEVVVGVGNSPNQDNESKSHKSESAGIEILSMAMSSLAKKETVASQQVPSMGCPTELPSV